MTEQQARQATAALFVSHLGETEKDGLCPAWVAADYNECVSKYARTVTKTLPRKTMMDRKWAWCAATATAIQYRAGLGDAGVYEMSCANMVTIAKAKGIWLENESEYGTPTHPARIGDLVIYSWDDSAKDFKTTDCKAATDHVGMVTAVYDDYMIVTEGNYKNSVKQRKLEYNGLYIRGFILLDYSSMATDEDNATTTEYCPPDLKRGSRGESVRALQSLLNLRINAGLATDGSFGSLTQTAVLTFQRNTAQKMDGIVTASMWARLIGE